MTNVSIEKSVTVRASLRRASYERRELKLLAASEEAEGVERMSAAIGEVVQEASIDDRTGGGISRNDEHF